MLAQLEGHVVEHGQIGEQRAELEQHAHAPAQRVQAVLIELVDQLAGDSHAPAGGLELTADQRSVVVLPQPDSPMIETTFPRGKRMLMPLSTGRTS